jgi:hypothetical protein
MEKRGNLAKALYDLGKLTFGALVLGQFISENQNYFVLIGGLGFTILVFLVAYKIDGKR